MKDHLDKDGYCYEPNCPVHKMNKTLTEKIEEIVGRGIFEGAIGNVSAKRRRAYTQSLLTLFQEEMEEVIGEDEDINIAVKTKSDAGAGWTIGRNALRQELRALLSPKPIMQEAVKK
jgi:hypothetical protein